ncbi:MAG: hypothetical protein U5R14_14940 [Gemmatimonadota bacterium]|nr:hypothetical protein [Gemmatimonadota bacterium]
MPWTSSTARSTPTCRRPRGSVALDSLQIDFSTGANEAFHVAGAFGADMDAGEALLALSELLPGYTAPPEMPFELGSMGDALVRAPRRGRQRVGGYGGNVVMGGDGELASLEGSAAVRLGAPRPSGDAWMGMELDLAGREMEADAALATLSTVVPVEWASAGRGSSRWARSPWTAPAPGWSWIRGRSS